ncbi:helix-turn-helix domain-containing protein [candidate division KSB1 bacterium]|nr:helix-turn-helix domain-containing protein [candidate division KSB1 bacterium]
MVEVKSKPKMEPKDSSVQIKHARVLEHAILQIRDEKRDIDEVFNEFNLNYKRKTYYSLKKKYEASGISGLISQKQKCGRKVEKSPEEVRAYIQQLKEQAVKIKGFEIQAKIKERFGIQLSLSQISRISKKLALESKLGRPCIRQEYDLHYAGLFIFLAAVLETGIIDKLLSYQNHVISSIVTDSAQPNQGIREEKGIFSKKSDGKFQVYPKETEIDYQQNGFISNKFRSVNERIKTRDLNRLGIAQAQEKSLIRKNLTILSLPVITNHSRFSEINETLGNELKYFSGYDYRANTIDKFMREMKYLRSSGYLMQQMANFWYHLWQDNTASEITQVCYYFDGNRKPLWSDYRVRQSKVTKLGRVMGCLEQVYIHSEQGHPILLQTFSGGVNLAEAIKMLNHQIEKIIPSPFSRISIFDAAANSVDFFETFGEHDYFICILDRNQYQPDLSDITIKSKVELDEATYIDGEKRLRNSKTKKWYLARVPVYKAHDCDEATAFVTSIPVEKMNAQQVIEMYYKRWPNQENQFRDMSMGGDLNTNDGFGKTRVINLVVQHKKKYLEEQIEAKKSKISEISAQIKIIEDETHHCQVTSEQKKQSNQSEIRIFEDKIKTDDTRSEVPKMLKTMQALYSQQQRILTDMLKRQFQSKNRIEKLQNQAKRQTSLLTKHQKEYERIKDKEIIYENDVELDQLLGMYKIAFANLSAYVLKEYFSGTVSSLEKLIRKVFQRPGKLIIEGQNTEVKIYLSKKDVQMSVAIRNACEKLNSKSVKNFDERLLKFTPVDNDE